MPHFECGAFDHSATSPGAITGAGFAPRSGRVLGEDGWPDKAAGGENSLEFRSNMQPIKSSAWPWVRHARPGHDEKANHSRVVRKSLKGAAPFFSHTRINHDKKEQPRWSI